MFRLKVAAMLALALSALNANANVTYEWTPVSTDLPPLNVKMSVTFSDAAVASGKVNFVLTPCSDADAHPLPGMNYGYSCDGIPDAEVQSFGFGAGHGAASIFFQPAKETYVKGAYMDLSVIGSFSGDYFTGYVTARNEWSIVTISSSGNGLSAITYYGSDNLGADDGCELSQQHNGVSTCNGATGYFARAEATNVPEPGSLALTGLGVTALLSRRRNRKNET
jgi:hypothetical protein